jgi:hypothetical protein
MLLGCPIFRLNRLLNSEHCPLQFSQSMQVLRPLHRGPCFRVLEIRIAFQNMTEHIMIPHFPPQCGRANFAEKCATHLRFGHHFASMEDMLEKLGCEH